MSVTLKITFNDDLRRVTLPATTTFDDLKKRLSQMFSDYVLNNRLSYIDDEDDRVTIQTTEELQEAFRLSRGGVLRLFVEENEDDEDADYEEIDSDDESDDRVHSAICDNCDERIVGIRYKCGNCADYDLCQSCEKHDGVHDSTHLFIKIRAPLSPWASPVRVLLPNLYPQQQHQQVPCWARRVQQYMAQREQCERQRAAQREQYEQHAQRVQQARQQWFEQLQAQRAAQASNGCPRFAGQCGRPASSEQPQCGRPASAEHPFANFFQHLIQQIEALNEREEESNTNTNNNNTNTDESAEQPNPFRVVIHFRNNEEQKEEQKEEKPEQQQQAQPDVTSSEVLVEDVVEDAPKQSYQPEGNQPILTDAQPEPSAPVVEEPKQEVVEQVKPVVEEPKRELTRFEQLLNTLEDMGFTDRRKNIEVLVRTAGNLEAAVQSLISF